VNKGRALLGGICLLLPSIFLAVAGATLLQDGSAVDAAFPVPLSLSNNTPMPRAAYVDAAEILRNTNDHDGDAQIARAEAMFRAGSRSEQVTRLMESGLKSAPASFEGWTYYAAILATSDPSRAGQALDQSFTLAPNEYFLAGLRAELGARLWASLSEETKSEVLRQARMLWEEPTLRDELAPLLATTDGAQLLTRAYSGAPGTIRDINRWMQVEERKSAPHGS
jgi:hypothetical protein